MSRVDSAVSIASIASAARQDVERASANALDTMRRMWPIQVSPSYPQRLPDCLVVYSFKRQRGPSETCRCCFAWPTDDVDISKSPWMLGCSLTHARSGVQAGLFTSGTIGLLIFPFITYVPTSGALGDMLPKVSGGPTAQKVFTLAPFDCRH